jgi:hypothetical protein
MVNYIKNNSSQGLYITEDQGSQIGNNTPGNIDLDQLSLGDSYIYFDNIQRFEEKTTYNREEAFVGWKTVQDASTKIAATTGGGKRNWFLISVECNLTTAENFKKLATLNAKISDELKYIVKQYASESFEQFTNESGTLKKWAGIIIRGYDIVEKHDSGYDVKLINIACEQIMSRN